MTSDERKTLEALAGMVDHHAAQYAATGMQGLAGSVRAAAAAIRSALAEVDALTQQVATLTAESADLNAENDMLNARVITGAQQVQDLEARAIPKELIEPAMRPDSIDTFYVYLEPDDSEREADRTIMFVCNGRIVTQDYNTVVDYPTVGDALKALSAALRAATEAT